MPRTLRSTSVVPASRSSAAICWEAADWVKESASAAAENEPRWATSRRTRMRRTSSISITYTDPVKASFELMEPVRHIALTDQAPAALKGHDHADHLPPRFIRRHA